MYSRNIKNKRTGFDGISYPSTRRPTVLHKLRNMKRPTCLALAAFFLFVIRPTVQAATPQSKGEIQSRMFASEHLGKELAYQLYLPLGYDPRGSVRYPTLYLLHGRGDNMMAWKTIKPELDSLIGEGRIPAVIAIMPDVPSSRRASYYIDSLFTGTDKLPAGEAVESALTLDLVAHIDATCPTNIDRLSRIVAGYSMGGYGALRYALAHPELFGGAIVLSPAVYLPLPPPDSSAREFGAFGRGTQLFDKAIYTAKNYPAVIPTFTAKGLPLVMFLAVGDDEYVNDDPAQASHDLDYETHTFYNRLRRVPCIKSQLRVVDGGHNWKTWRPTFIEGVQYIFHQLGRLAAKDRYKSLPGNSLVGKNESALKPDAVRGNEIEMGQGGEKLIDKRSLIKM